MKKILFIIFSILIISSCTDEDTALQVLEDNGYTNVRITGYSMFSCGEDDVTSTGFEAITPSGKYVTGSVCGGWGKGYTIRFDN